MLCISQEIYIFVACLKQGYIRPIYYTTLHFWYGLDKNGTRTNSIGAVPKIERRWPYKVNKTNVLPTKECVRSKR